MTTIEDRALHVAYWATGYLAPPEQQTRHDEAGELGAFVLAAMSVNRIDLVRPLIDTALRCAWTPRYELVRPTVRRFWNNLYKVLPPGETLPRVTGLVEEAERAAQQLRDETGPMRLVYIRALVDLWSGAFWSRAEFVGHEEASLRILGLLAEVHGAIHDLADKTITFPGEGRS